MSALPVGASKWRLGLVVLAIFVAGVATGIAVNPLLRPPPPGPHGPPPWLRDLDLSEQQRASARSIFERHRAEVDAIMRDIFPRVRARNEQMEQELKAILTPAQAAKLDEIRAHRPPRPPPGPMFDGPPPPPDGPRGDSP